MHFMPRKAKPAGWLYQPAGGAGVRVVCILFAGSRRREVSGAGLGMHFITARRGMKKGAHIKYAPEICTAEKVCSSRFQRFKTRAASCLTSSSVRPV